MDAGRRALLGGALGAGIAGVSAGPARAERPPAYTVLRRGESIQGGLVLSEGRTILEHCEIEGGRDGVAVHEDAQLTMINCVVKNVRRHGVYVTSQGRVQILNSRIAYCGENGVRVQPSDPDAGDLDADVLIQGNVIEQIAAPWGDGATGNAISGWKAHGLQIFANRCASFVYSAIRLADCHDSMLIGNRCVGGLRDSQIYLEFAFYGAIVANNEFANGAGGLEATNFLGGDGGGLYRGRQAIVTGNRFRNFRQKAAKIEADVIFAQNIVEGGEWGVWAGWGPACRNLSVSGNLFMNSRYGVGLSEVDADPVIVEGNRFYGVEMPVTAYTANWEMIAAGIAARPLPAETRHVLRNNWSGAALIGNA